MAERTSWSTKRKTFMERGREVESVGFLSSNMLDAHGRRGWLVGYPIVTATAGCSLRSEGIENCIQLVSRQSLAASVVPCG